MQVNIEDFRRKMQTDLNYFILEWQNSRAKCKPEDVKNWPSTLPQEEWFEQFMVYIQRED